MSSYFSSFSSITSSPALSNLSTRFTSLRRAISSVDEVDDPEDEDLSHISNALRAYYGEKGRPLPPWLPPDPKKAAAAPSAPVLATQSSLQGYGGQTPPASQPPARGGGLGDLWGDRSASNQPQSSQSSNLRLVRSANQYQQQQQQQQQQTSSTSLKPPGGGLPHRPSSSSARDPQPPPFERVKSSNAVLESDARPLPSQRAGSYQASQAQMGNQGSDRMPAGGVSAQERLRARLHAGSPRRPTTGQGP